MAGLQRPTTGEVRLAGVPIVHPGGGCPSSSSTTRPHYLPWRNALDNVLFGLRARGEEGGQLRQSALALLDRMGLAAPRRAALPVGALGRHAAARGPGPRPPSGGRASSSSTSRCDTIDKRARRVAPGAAPDHSPRGDVQHRPRHGRSRRGPPPVATDRGPRGPAGAPPPGDRRRGRAVPRGSALPPQRRSRPPLESACHVFHAAHPVATDQRSHPMRPGLPRPAGAGTTLRIWSVAIVGNVALYCAMDYGGLAAEGIEIQSTGFQSGTGSSGGAGRRLPRHRLVGHLVRAPGCPARPRSRHRRAGLLRSQRTASPSTSALAARKDASIHGSRPAPREDGRRELAAEPRLPHRRRGSSDPGRTIAARRDPVIGRS